MYNKYLSIFIEVANAGSFSKASEKLYISIPAIIKQINHLENDLGIKLFKRSHKGLSLTEEGKFIYEKAQYIIEFSNNTLKQARDMHEHHIHDIRIGTSKLRHFYPYIDVLKKLKSDYPDFNINIVSFDDERTSYRALINELGKNIDFLFGIYPSINRQSNTSVYHLCDYKLCLAVSINNPLSSRKSITFDDLKGHKVIMVERGDTDYIDYIRDKIENEYPDIEIINVPAYDIDTFNFCNEINGIMISVDLWDKIHPLLVNVPLEAEFYAPYGLIYSAEPDQKVKEFIKIFKRELD